MRALLFLLLLVLGLRPACAQARIARLQFDDGRTVVGQIVQIDESGIALRIDGKVVAFPTARVRSYTAEDAPAEAPAADPEAPGPGSEPAIAAVALPRSSRALWSSRLQALDREFPWLAPAERSQWFSLAVTLFALLSLAVHIAARLSATDHLGFGRATLIALWFLLTGVLQVALVPPGPGWLAAMMAGNAVVAVLLFRFAYGLSSAAAGLALFLFCLQGGVVFALLRLVDATLRSIGNTTF